MEPSWVYSLGQRHRMYQQQEDLVPKASSVLTIKFVITGIAITK